MLKSSGLFLFLDKLCESGALVFSIHHIDDAGRALHMTSQI